MMEMSLIKIVFGLMPTWPLIPLQKAPRNIYHEAIKLQFDIAMDEIFISHLELSPVPRSSIRSSATLCQFNFNDCSDEARHSTPAAKLLHFNLINNEIFTAKKQFDFFN